MQAFFDATDLGGNLHRGLRAVDGLHGLAALIPSACLGLLSFVFLRLAWYFDILPTMAWVDAEYPYNLLIAMLPTAIELGAGRIAAASVAMAKWLIYAATTFDLFTDWPAAAAAVEAWAANHAAQLAQFGAAQGVVVFAIKLAWLVCASFLFEMLGIVFLVCAARLLVQAFRKPAAAGVRT